MIATSSQPGMFPITTSDNTLTLVHTLPPPGSTAVSVQPMNTMPSTSGQVIPATHGICIPTIPEMQTAVKKVYPCSFCEKQFGSRYNATRHEKGCKMAPPGSGGNQTNPEPILCPNCGKHFQTHDGMTRHMRKKCKLSSEYNEQQSAQRWTGKKIHLCKYCGKQFSTKWNAIRHENLFHTSDEPVLHSLIVAPYHQQPEPTVPRKPERYCRFCGSYFSTKYNAIRHEKICTRVNSSGGNSIISDAEATTTSITHTKVATMEIDASAALQQEVQPTPQPVLQVQQQQQQIVLQQQRPQQAQVQQQVQVQQQNQAQQQQLNQQIQQLQQAVQLQRQQQQQQQQQQTQIQQQHEVQQNQQPQQLIIQHQIQHQHNQQPTQQQQTIQHQQQPQPQPQHQQVGIQQTQHVNITPQQVVFIQPFHVCKFCNKQLDSKCDPTPILREDLQNGTINTNQLQGASIQLQTPINPTILTGVSLPTMLAAIPHNITIPIQAQTPQRTANTQQIVTNSPQIVTQHQVQTQPQQVQHQVQVQLQPQTLSAQQVVAQVVAQSQPVQQQVQQQQVQQQPQRPQPQIQQQSQISQQQSMQTPTTQNQPARASPTSISAHQKPHGCKFCNKHFATKWYLDQHEKIHTGRAVTCNICNKSFVTRWHLDKHVRVHIAGGKKAKRETEQTEPGEANFTAGNALISVSEGDGTVQQSTINGTPDGMVVPLTSFGVTADTRTQLPQFGLSPMQQQEQADK